jgi:hypothetical protein
LVESLTSIVDDDIFPTALELFIGFFTNTTSAADWSSSINGSHLGTFLVINEKAGMPIQSDTRQRRATGLGCSLMHA